MTMQTGTTLFSLPLLELNGHMVTLGESLLAIADADCCLARCLAWRATAEDAPRQRPMPRSERLWPKRGSPKSSRHNRRCRAAWAPWPNCFGARQAELNQSIGQRIDGMTQRLGSSITEQTRPTHENLSKLQERLAVIDTAQNNIQSLARDVVGLQAILSNKQTRGAFGQSRMETIIKDGLPMGAFSFQPTLSNGTRPDCTVPMPNGAPDLVIDAKFPLEAWNAMREAEAEAAWRSGPAGRTAALPPGYGGAYPRHFGEVPDCRRNPGHGLPVRAVGIDLRRNPRDLRGDRAARRTGRGW
jgi:DNA recombination protein RmuC